MIEVNLLPGGKRRAPRRPKLAIPVPSLKGLPGDPWVLGVGAFAVVAALVIGYLFLSTRERYGELEAQVEAAAADSARYAGLIEAIERLRARRDSIAQRVAIIQEIDGDRYVWPHIMDELGAALPDYTWLVGLVQLEGGSTPRFRIDGRAGNNFAITRFMRNLEASPFVREVRLVTTELVAEGDRVLHAFSLEARYEPPAPDVIQTVPLFREEEAPVEPE